MTPLKGIRARLKEIGAPGARASGTVERFQRGYHYGRDSGGGLQPTSTSTAGAGWLEQYSDAHSTGPGFAKWQHYFGIYEKHFARFRGREVHVLEIGIGSGGSVGMWKTYFGDDAHIYGIDVRPECRAFEGPGIRVFIGDQSDRSFWSQFLGEVPEIDIVIDDGSHRAAHQIRTLEALLPHIRPGGVYLCEDIHGERHPFHDFVDGFSRNLHAWDPVQQRSTPTDFQRAVESVHLYPYVVVIEKRLERLDALVVGRYGSEWR